MWSHTEPFLVLHISQPFFAAASEGQGGSQSEQHGYPLSGVMKIYTDTECSVEPTLLQDLQARIDKRLVFLDPTLYLEHFLIGRNWQLSVIIGPDSTTENRHSSEASENRG